MSNGAMPDAISSSAMRGPINCNAIPDAMGGGCDANYERK